MNPFKGKKNGKGHFVSLSGYSYDGEWKDDLREGKGVFTLVDGATYKVNFYSSSIQIHTRCPLVASSSFNDV